MTGSKMHLTNAPIWKLVVAPKHQYGSNAQQTIKFYSNGFHMLLMVLIVQKIQPAEILQFSTLKLAPNSCSLFQVAQQENTSSAMPINHLALTSASNLAKSSQPKIAILQPTIKTKQKCKLRQKPSWTL